MTGIFIIRTQTARLRSMCSMYPPKIPRVALLVITSHTPIITSMVLTAAMRPSLMATMLIISSMVACIIRTETIAMTTAPWK